MHRKKYINKINHLLKSHPAVALLGPRQCGKTTLAKQLVSNGAHGPVTYFDLEDPRDLARLDAPLLALEPLTGLIVIDEIQRRSELFSILRVLIDQKQQRQFLILGSASKELLKQSSESLAGRIAYLELTPFSLDECDDLSRLWLRGGFPLSYLAKNIAASNEWREFYIQTFLEQDVPNLGFRVPARTLRRFWMMLSHYHGGIFNASEIGSSLGVAHTTIRHYLDILTGTFMIRELQPWYANIQKRQIKSSKIYFRDSGIYHYLTGIYDRPDLLNTPKLGISWEGFALEQIIAHHQMRMENCFFWGIHHQAELDLLIFAEGERLGFEFKYSDAPTLTRAMKLSQETLQLDKLTVIYPGKKTYLLAKNIQAVGLEDYMADS